VVDHEVVVARPWGLELVGWVGVGAQQGVVQAAGSWVAGGVPVVEVAVAVGRLATASSSGVQLKSPRMTKSSPVRRRVRAVCWMMVLRACRLEGCA
jgi:hypothetical protein